MLVCKELVKIEGAGDRREERRRRGNQPIQEIHRNTKVAGHAIQSHDAIALQELLVRAQAHLADEPVLVLVQVSVLGEELLLHQGQRLEEELVPAVVQAADQLRERVKIDRHLRLGLLRAAAEGGQVDHGRAGRHGRAVDVLHRGVGAGSGRDGARQSQKLVLAVAEDRLDLGCVHNLGLEVDALERDGTGQHGVHYQVAVGAELVRGEGRQAVEEQGGRAAVVAHGEQVQTLVGLEAVATVPVAAGLDERLGALDRLLDQLLVAEEKAETNYGEDEIDLGAEDARLLEEVLVRGDGFLLDRGGGSC